jgi:hypothetical protein
MIHSGRGIARFESGFDLFHVRVFMGRVRPACNAPARILAGILRGGTATGGECIVE